jgi:hypothetical protein
MVTNMVLNNLLVSLVFVLLGKYFLCDETYHVYLIVHACWHDAYIYFNEILLY